ncbi:MAG: hypothetical protein OEY89_02200 [Gammaproteobacteria bacterium]|nr:hypothetical protein [Gammaproteobacteria bacterium]
MIDSSKETGMILAVLERCKNQKLPRALALKAKVDGGEKLSEYDIRFMEEAIKDANQIKPLLDRHPEFSPLVSRIFHLFKDISEKSLANENQK